MNINIKLNEMVAPMYFDVLKDILNHGHTHYTLAGGRGSTKSSFVGGISVPLLVMRYPGVNAVCFRKIGNTIENSIRSQVIWGIYKLGVENLFIIPKTYSNPIVYKPTGQKIFFMGLDDPNKVKSIKTSIGYIGITWWEELDQFAGEFELRKVLQSTMRGGDKFWDFRTFNPPISRNNWANEYIDNCEIFKDPDTLVVRNTYLDVPRQWLGEQFIAEAERLKALNERAYKHEYLGQALGTGGDVFANVQDLDMEKTVEILDSYGNPINRVPMWKTFDKVYNGIDWGFAIDPTRFVKMHFDRDMLDLYIFDEYNTNKSRVKDIFDDLYENYKKIRKDEMLIADSGGGGLFAIADFKAYGAFIRQAVKGNDSVAYGIKWLQGLNHIYIDKRRCPYTYSEFVSYEYEQDREGNFISAYPDENNHSIDAVRYGMERYANRKGN